MPWECVASNPAAISMANERTVSMSSDFPAMRCFRGYAVQKLHGNERLLAVLADFVDGADIGMIESRCRASLPAKAFQGLRSRERSSGRNFRATKRPSSVSSAL